MFNFFTSVILCIALFNLNWTLKKYTNPDNINTWLFRAFFALVVINTAGFIGLIIFQYRVHQITEVTSKAIWFEMSTYFFISGQNINGFFMLFIMNKLSKNKQQVDQEERTLTGVMPNDSIVESKHLSVQTDDA